MRKSSIVIIACLSILMTFGSFMVAMGAISLDSSNRREYTWCPMTDSNAKTLNAEINGCPLVRVYINDWNRLTPLQQSDIDSRMRAMGFVDAGEHIIR